MSQYYSPEECPLKNSDHIVFSGPKDAPMLEHLIRSLRLLSPCWRQIHIVCLEHEGAQLRGNLSREVLEVVQIHEELKEPAELKLQYSMHERKQWINFWCDNYTKGTDFTIMWDSDVVA